MNPEHAAGTFQRIYGQSYETRLDQYLLGPRPQRTDIPSVPLRKYTHSEFDVGFHAEPDLQGNGESPSRCIKYCLGLSAPSKPHTPMRHSIVTPCRQLLIDNYISPLMRNYVRGGTRPLFRLLMSQIVLICHLAPSKRLERVQWDQPIHRTKTGQRYSSQSSTGNPFENLPSDCSLEDVQAGDPDA